jgi:hypothetical protein
MIRRGFERTGILSIDGTRRAITLYFARAYVALM